MEKRIKAIKLWLKKLFKKISGKMRGRNERQERVRRVKRQPTRTVSPLRSHHRPTGRVSARSRT